MNEQRIPEVERVIRTYDEGFGAVIVVETTERGDGSSSFISITFSFQGNKLRIDEWIAEKLFLLVNSLKQREVT